MKIAAILFVIFILAASISQGALDKGDLEEIRVIVKESEERLRTELKGDIESNSKQISELRSDMRSLTAVIVGGFIALVIAVIGQGIIVGRGAKSPA